MTKPGRGRGDDAKAALPEAGQRRPGRGKKEPPPPKAWRREHAGVHVSADERFRIEQEGPGRWFVVDEEQRDELGLARTTGPFGTLDEARTEADRLRSTPATVSPLLPRIAAQREREQPKGAAVPPTPASGRSKAQRSGSETAGSVAFRAVDAAAESAPGAGRHGSSSADVPAPPPPPPPTWLERLPPDDATRARRLISALRRLGIADAERTVRADVEGGRPAVARAILARRLREAAIESWRRAAAFERAEAAVRDALQHAASLGVADDELATIVDFVARRTLSAALEQVSALERDPEAPATLPGWRLVEHDPARPDRERRIDVTGEDVERLRLDDATDSGSRDSS